MADIVDKATRSRMMAGIRGKDTRPEIALRKALHARGLRFRLHERKLPGRPDIVLPKHRALILVHGCFWHRHEGCRFATTPSTRPEFWEAKFAANKARDARNLVDLGNAGWRIWIAWECEIRAAGPEPMADRIIAWLERRVIWNGPVQDAAPVPHMAKV